MDRHGDDYVIIGVPMGEPADIEQFINEREVETITHVVDADQPWALYDVKGSPTWMTITISGETAVRTGAMTASMFRGEWAE